MMLEITEIENLEQAINVAVKQTSLLMFMASMVPDGSPFTTKDILYNNVLFQKALQSIEKLRQKYYDSLEELKK